MPFWKNNSPCPPCSGIRGKEARGGRDTGMRIVRGLWDAAHGGSALASREALFVIKVTNQETLSLDLTDAPAVG